LLRGGVDLRGELSRLGLALWIELDDKRMSVPVRD
jgi:hypothetical protein